MSNKVVVRRTSGVVQRPQFVPNDGTAEAAGFETAWLPTLTSITRIGEMCTEYATIIGAEQAGRLCEGLLRRELAQFVNQLRFRADLQAIHVQSQEAQAQEK